jgi:hypothetical protein
MDRCYMCDERFTSQADGVCDQCRRVEASQEAFELQRTLGAFFTVYDRMNRAGDVVGLAHARTVFAAAFDEIEIKHFTSVKTMRELGAVKS